MIHNRGGKGIFPSQNEVFCRHVLV
jgi:hypothetical protein